MIYHRKNFFLVFEIFWLSTLFLIDKFQQYGTLVFLDNIFIYLLIVCSFVTMLIVLYTISISSVMFWIWFQVKLGIWEWRIKNHWQINLSQTILVTSSNLFLIEFMLIYLIKTLSVCFNLTFFKMLFIWFNRRLCN